MVNMSVSCIDRYLSDIKLSKSELAVVSEDIEK
jgi:hypothetical protein